MRNRLRETLGKLWTNSGRTGKGELIIRADSVYRTYAEDQDPGKLFEQLLARQAAIQSRSASVLAQYVILEQLQESMAAAIFGSNQIERAGANLDVTIQLCRQVFGGEEVEDITEDTPEHTGELQELVLKDKSLENLTTCQILRKRAEVVQHARAFQHIIYRFVVKQQPLSESLIKETHAILVKGVNIEPEGDYPPVPYRDYAGRYRTVAVGAGSTMFVPPRFVGGAMTKMCQAAGEEMTKAEEEGAIDPVSVATKYSMDFVQIHPFRDGNGRMCRMILNAILCRYLGVVVPIGEHGEEERKEYIGVKVRASEECTDHGEYATLVLVRASRVLNKLRKKIALKEQ